MSFFAIKSTAPRMDLLSMVVEIVILLYTLYTFISFILTTDQIYDSISLVLWGLGVPE